MARLRKSLVLVGVVTLACTLTACDAGGAPLPGPGASGTPAADPTPVPTPTDEPVLHPSAIIVDGDSVSVTISEGGTLIDIPFTTAPDAAVAQLTEAIDLVATVSSLPASACFPERQQATWGAVSFVWGDDWQRAPGAQFLAQAISRSTTNGITVTIPSGHWVGTPDAEVVLANNTSPLIDNGGWRELHYDVANGSATGNPDEYYGAYAVLDDGVLTSIASPIHYFYDC